MEIEKLRQVAAVQDESSHWYVIPIELKEQFFDMLETYSNTESNEVLEQFEDFFTNYRTGGDLNNIKLYAKL